MDELTCPYCGSEMKPITSVTMAGVKAYFKCDNCNARGPRIKQPYIGDDHYGIARQTQAATIAAAIDLARTATVPLDVMDMEIPAIDTFDSVLN